MSDPEVPKTTNPALEGASRLYPGEVWWRDHSPWLKEQGYSLRARYQPDWIPSWERNPKQQWIRCEDALTSLSPKAIDAIRQDGKLVVLKRVQLSKEPHELEIGRLFSDSLADNPNNYCVPLLDVLRVPNDDDTTIIVMPLLYHYNVAPLETIGEGVELIRQLLEGLYLMHQNNIAHRDVKYLNIMADVISHFDAPPHPRRTSQRRDFKGPSRQRYSRTQRPVKHLFIDFGLSKEYKPEDAPHLEPGAWGGDRTVPEFQQNNEEMSDPFLVDVYCMGNFVRSHFLQGTTGFPRKLGFDFLHDLVEDMVQDDPSKRPSMKEVVSRFSDIVKGLDGWKLRSRVVLATERRSQRVFREIGHWMKQATYVVRGIPAIPRA